MRKIKTVTAYVVVSISKIYKDIYNIFFDLVKINWPDCKWDIIEISDMDDTVYGKYQVKKGKVDTIPDCIYRVSEMYPADFYMFFLGDAFITRRVDNTKVENLLFEMQENGFKYCNLLKNHICRKNTFYERLKKTESYGVQFITFIASKDFINTEFNKKVTDFDFEQKYLIIASKATEEYYENYIAADKRLFGVLHGINKGCWIRKSYQFLRKKYPNIQLGNRRKQSLKIEIYEDLAYLSSQLLTTKTRSKIKQLMCKKGKKFYTNY